MDNVSLYNKIISLPENLKKEVQNFVQLLQTKTKRIQGKNLVNLEDHHRDPFDRIIIAQAKHESWTIISKDENFPRYALVKLIW